MKIKIDDENNAVWQVLRPINLFPLGCFLLILYQYYFSFTFIFVCVLKV